MISALTAPIVQHNMADASPLPARLVDWKHRHGWLLASLLFVAVRAIPNLCYPIGRDQATYLTIGQGLLNGQLLYRDLWDNKPPGVFYLFALVVKVFGPVMWCIGLLDIFWLLAISYFIFRFTERYLGTGAAVVAVVFNASWHVWAGYWEAVQTETFLILSVFASFFLVTGDGRWVRLRHLLAGILFGAAFWLKYNALALMPLVVLLPYLDMSGLDSSPRRVGLSIPCRRWLGRVLAFLLGFGGAVGVVLVLFWFSDSWAALKEVQFVVLPRYAAMALERTPHYPLWAVVQTELVLGSWTEVALFVAFVIAWRKHELARLGPILVAVGLGYLCVALQVRFHYYAFETVYPFFAMAWGYVVVKIFQGFRVLAQSCQARGWKLARVLVWVLFVNMAAWPLPEQIANIVAHYKALAGWWREREVFYAAYPWPNPISHFPDQMRVISYLRKNLGLNDGVFVWGSEPLIYFLTRRPCPARFVSNLALMAPWSPPAWRNEMVRQLEKSPPRFLVVARDDAVPYIAYTRRDSEEYLQVYPELAIFIADYYEPAEDLDNFVIYERRGFSQAGVSRFTLSSGKN